MLQKFIRSLLTVAMVLLTCGGASAAGGIQFGPLNVAPSVELTEEHTSNVFYDSAESTADWVTTVSPALRLALPIRRFLLAVEGRADWISYQEQSAEDSVNWSVSGSVGAVFPMGLSFTLKSTYSDTYLTSTQEFGPGEDSATGDTSVKIAYTIRDTFKLDFEWATSTYVFETSAERERAENAYTAGFFWKFRPTMSALLQAGWTEFSYDTNTAQDGEEWSLDLGLTWDVGVRSTGFVKGGYQWKIYDVEDEKLNTENGGYYTVGVGLSHQFTSRTSLSASVNRESVESDFQQNPYYLRNEVHVGLSQAFGQRITVGVSGDYGRDIYPAETTYTNPYDPEKITGTGRRTDTTLGGELNIGFAALSWLNLELYATIESRTSTFETFDNTVTVLGARIAARF